MTLDILQVMMLVFRLLVPAALFAAVVRTAWNANKNGRNALTWNMPEAIVQSSENVVSLVVSCHTPPILAGPLRSVCIIDTVTTRM